MSTELITSGLFDNIDLSQITNMEIDGEAITKIAIIDNSKEYTIWSQPVEEEDDIILTELILYDENLIETTNLSLPASTNTIKYTLMFDEDYYNAYSNYMGSPKLAAEAIINNISFTSHTEYFDCNIVWNDNTPDFYLYFTKKV